MSIGCIGAGNIGSTVAKLAVANGRNVVLTNTRGADSIKELLTSLGPKAKFGSLEEVAKCDIILIATPTSAMFKLPADVFKGKIVIDSNNYFPGRDGQIADIDNGAASSAVLQKQLPGAKVVKMFNTIYFVHLGGQGVPKGTDNRRALPIAADDAGAKKAVADLVEEFGFDVLDIGDLKGSKKIEPGSPCWNVRHSLPELKQVLGML